MTDALQTTVAELPGSRVRVRVQVPAAELERRLEGKAQQLGRELKLPGFRRGKVPPALVIQRVGREAVLDQAVRDSLAGWYAQAIQESGIVPVGDPQLDLSDLPSEGSELEFSIEIGVLPKAQLGDYKGLEVPRREPEVEDAQIEREIDAVRERLAKLETAERAAAEGDFVVIDYVGSLPAPQQGDSAPEQGPELVPFAGGEGRDQLIELGGGNLIPGFEEALVGASAGEQKDVKLTFPEDYPNEELAGKHATFAVTVKEVKLKRLPDVDEDLAIDVGFDSVGELREDIRTRLLGAEQERVDDEYREAALDAAVAQATVPVTPELVESRTREIWDARLHSLAHQGISREMLLKITGREEADMLAELKDDAERTLRREAVLSAIVAAEQIEPTEQRLLETIAPAAEREGVDPQKLLADLRSSGRLEELRERVAARMAEDLLAERAQPISTDRRSTGSPIGQQAHARQQLWTPGQDAESQEAIAGGAGAGKLWTPTEERSAS